MQYNLNPKSEQGGQTELQEKRSHSHSRSSVFRESVEISQPLTPLLCSLTPQTLGNLRGGGGGISVHYRASYVMGK